MVMVGAAIALGAPVAASAARVEFMDPRDGTVVQQAEVRVTGRADHDRPTAASFDVMLVIDVSGSTRVPVSAVSSGIVIGGGLGDIFRMGGPTILDVEITAAQRFVDAADRQSTRIGVVTFSEAHSAQSGGTVEQPLTFDYAAIRATLNRIQSRTPNGGTDMVAGVRLAIRELRHLTGAVSAPRPEARKVALLLTDGFPTLPFPNQRELDPRNVSVTLDAVRVAGKAGIVMHTFCLGREALSAPIVCREAASITGGRYHPVQNPADIVALLPATRIADVAVLSVRNATTGQMAKTLDVAADGRFTADVPLAPGANRLVVQVPGADAASVVVHYQPDVKIEVERDPSRDVHIQVERPEPGR